MTRILRADQNGPRIVPAVIVDAQEHARRLIEQATARADAMRAAAEADCAAVLERAEREGRERGQLEGREAFASGLVQLSLARERWLSGLPPQLIELAMAAAEHIVGAQLDAHPETIDAIVRPLLGRLRRAQRVVLHVHPDDERWLRSSLPALQLELGERAAVELQADPTLTRGGCVLTSDIGAIDGRLETRLERLDAALKQTARSDGE